ncbi:hypothetical protein [Microlunatus antarcticus]|uniref:DUF559 domain-containing protein n=1 Tax=Microlunatus antarcticus TaxID=53388 RepID=A0A7W5P7Z0_9ACTN|nr:hypothetical protein [Microlunatus antarcticus]MBB3327381.1 hypothetical protein [Microlunatus antarcticus]
MPKPFTTSQAASPGLGRGRLRGRSVRRQLRGAYLLGDEDPGERDRVAAALLVLPSGTGADGLTALRLQGVDLGGAAPLRFVTTHPHPVRRPEVRVRRTSTQPQLATVGELPSLGPEDAFVASAVDLDLVELVAAGDWLVRLGCTTPEALVAAASIASGRGSRVARRAAALVRARVDSVQETRLRLVIVLAGLPEPDVNPVVLARGRPVGRVDLLLWAYRTVIEYEGDQHRTDRTQWNRDIRRQEQLVADKNRLVRVTAERMRSPRAVVLTVYEAIVEGGYRGPAPSFDDEWRHLFATVHLRT